MNRLSLQEMRNLLIKKGRLLYGAVFLFCLVCLYGLYTSQWTKVSDLTVDSDSKVLDDKNGRGGTIPERADSGFITHSGKGKHAGEINFVSPVISLSGVLRGRPLDDPFTHPLIGEGVTVIDGNARPAVNGYRTQAVDSYRTQAANSYRTQADGSYNNGQGNRGRNRGRNQVGNAQVRGRNPAPDVQVTGIITGSKPMAILSSNGNEGCYGVGEGPGGVKIQQITDRGVLIGGSGGSRWLYVE